MHNSVLVLRRAAIAAAALAMLTGSSIAASQSSSTSSSSAQSDKAADAQVTVTGCIQREADYRKSTDAGRGGVAGTGVGVSNEFVLTNAMLSAATASTSSASNSAGAQSTTGTSGTRGTVYELTGSGEGQASSFVGKRVEVVGKMKASAAAGGPTEKVPGSQDLKLQEFEVSTIRAATGGASGTAIP